MALEEIIGKKIIDIELSDDKSTIYFFTENEKIIYATFGDCCSESWIESTDKFDFPFTAINCNEKYVGEEKVTKEESKSDDDDRYLKQYFYEIISDKGMFSIELRNESNGYYGGSLDFFSIEKR